MRNQLLKYQLLLWFFRSLLTLHFVLTVDNEAVLRISTEKLSIRHLHERWNVYIRASTIRLCY